MTKIQNHSFNRLQFFIKRKIQNSKFFKKQSRRNVVCARGIINRRKMTKVQMLFIELKLGRPKLTDLCHAFERMFYVVRTFVGSILSMATYPQIGFSIVQWVSVYVVNTKTIINIKDISMQIYFRGFVPNHFIFGNIKLFARLLGVPFQIVFFFQTIKNIRINNCFHPFGNIHFNIRHAMELSHD